MPPPFDASAYDTLLRSFLNEDIGAGDVTTDTLISAEQRGHGELVAKAQLVLAGVDIFVEVFRLLDANIESEIRYADGQDLQPGAIPVKIRGSARALLTGERVALNLLQRLSGVATFTRHFVRKVEGTNAKIVDTRKTTPGLRELEKYAVRVGGGQSHRKDLGEAVLIKDNHIRFTGGVDAALTKAEAARGHAAWIEVEVTNLNELSEALRESSRQRPDVILLDNMNPALVREAVEQVRSADPSGKIRTEASGGVTLSNVLDFAEAGVDWISIGGLTHSAPSVDLSFESEPD